MTAFNWLDGLLTVLLLAALFSWVIVAMRRRRGVATPPQDGWLTDDMVRQIIEHGRLSGGQVPEAALDLEEIAREEERFWTESWDEPEHFWD
jgi:hypothetical protein